MITHVYYLQFQRKQEDIMGSLGIVLCIVAFLLLGGLAAMLIYTYPISKRVYRQQLVRTEPEKWGRVCSAPDNQEQQEMWNLGNEWAQQNREKMTEVSLRSEGFQLFGEYYDFGCDRCVIILPGRCESLAYSYYFAPPYQQAGFNVLVIDTRCHGKSEGIYNTIGVKERFDVIAWADYANTVLGNQEIWFHGICIGTAAGVYTMADPNCPKCVKGLVTEGCFVSFRETFKRHMMADKRPLFPVLDLVMFHINKNTGTNVYKDKPLSAFKKIPAHMRVLFLYGEKDIFSIPEKSQKLFDVCAAKDKQIVWFDKGGHSHLRINNTKKYDDAIISFFKE